MTTAAEQIFARHFNATTRRALTKAGVSFIGTTTLPGKGDLPFATGETGYVLNQSGTQIVRTFPQVLALAAG